MLRVRVIPRRFFLQSFVACKFKSTSASESIQTEFELNNRDVPDSFRGAAFAASKRGFFFQEAPRLRNQFSGDLFLQSYLKRIVPQEVGLLFNMISSFNTKVLFVVIIFNLSLFKLIFYLNSCHMEMITAQMKCDSQCWTEKRCGSVFLWGTAQDMGFPF